MSQPICPKCSKRMKVRTSKRIQNSQQQYLECQCGHETKREVPAESVWRRAARAAI